MNQIRSDGRYRYRVSEYKGDSNDNSARLKLSEANVAVYTMGGYSEYRVGIDGFMKVSHLNAEFMRAIGTIIACCVQSF